MNNTQSIGVGFLAGVAIMMIFMNVVISDYNVVKTKAIKYGCAQYNSQTGAFEWAGETGEPL